MVLLVVTMDGGDRWLTVIAENVKMVDSSDGDRKMVEDVLVTNVMEVLVFVIMQW